MKPFDQLLAEDIAIYTGRHADLIALAPPFYRLLTRLLGDPELPHRLRGPVIAAIAYFVLPAEIVPEIHHGPHDYVDDVFLAAFISDQVLWETGDEALLIRHWDGTVPILPLIRKILTHELELIGEQKWEILEYIGYSPL